VKEMRMRKFFLIALIILGVLSFFISGVEREPVEKVSISPTIGYDIEKDIEGNVEYSVALNLYVLDRQKKNSKTVVSKGKTLGLTREDRQRRIDKKFLLGFEKVYIIGEEYAKNGINSTLDILFRTSEVRDTAMICVCKGKAEDILQYQVEGYPSSGDFIEGLIKYSSQFNFNPENYKLVDAYIRLGAEGRNLIIPYIEVKEHGIEITGLAVFKKDKMINVIPKKDTKLLNLLRENKLMGMLSVEDNPKKYIEYYGRSKRKVECFKEGDKYRFIINLKITGDLVTNEFDNKLIDNPKNRKEIEMKFSKQLEEELNQYVKVVQNDHKTDCFELGRVACAKYGRNTGVDWDEIVSNSEIEVKASVMIDRFGRGDY
jgi:Ger(x)C family germination protein